MNANQLLNKSQQALESAKVLLQTNDLDGACNRAYYAMFDAARAALLLANTGVAPEVAKTHSGLLRAFSLHLVKPGRFPVELGKALKQVEDFRLVADYSGDPLELSQAQWGIKQAERFVQEVIARFT